MTCHLFCTEPLSKPIIITNHTQGCMSLSSGFIVLKPFAPPEHAELLTVTVE